MLIYMIITANTHTIRACLSALDLAYFSAVVESYSRRGQTVFQDTVALAPSVVGGSSTDFCKFGFRVLPPALALKQAVLDPGMSRERGLRRFSFVIGAPSYENLRKEEGAKCP